MSCQSCGFNNPPGFRFCGTCGARLADVERDAREVERKVISALFCDVVDSTARAERLDPEDVRSVLSPYYEGVRAHLVRFGGTVEKFIGDAVCGIFGAPRTYGDDPERAVRAALAIRDWVAEINDLDPRLGLHLRLGVATGEAVVALGARTSDGEAIAWGDVMNTAARIQTAAPIDSILVDEPTYRATRNVVEYGEADPVQAKGKNEPVLAWRALAPRARRGVDLAQRGRGPFVGREHEFELLRLALDRVGERRSPELVSIVGEAGIGKSRLAFELFRWVEDQPTYFTWRQTGSSPYGDVLTYWALGEIVKAQAGILETDDVAATAHKLSRGVGDLVPDPAEAARIENHLRSLVGLDAPAVTHGDQRRAAFVAWRSFLEAVAREYTLVLVFEDVHWADAGVLDFIEHVLDWSHGVPILILCTARPEFVELRPEWWSRENATTIALAPLSNDDMAGLVAALAPSEVASQAKDAIVGAASGNPLFAVEFVRMLVDQPEQAPTAESVRAVIAARLDALSAEDKLLLQDAAVVGKVVWPGVLSKLGDRSRRSVEERLRELVRREFMTRVTPSSVQGEDEFTFRHDLARDVAYEQLPRVRRAEIHRRTAEWLESLSPDRTKDRAEMIALHYVSAYEYAVASNSDVTELVEGARLSLRSAGDRALALNSFATAARHYRDALDIWPDEDPDLPALLLTLGKSRYYADAEGAEELAAAETGFRALGEGELAAEAADLYANLLYSSAGSREAQEHLSRALELVEGLGASRVRTEVLLDLAVFNTLAADPERTAVLAGEALRDAEALELPELQARALAMIGASRLLSGDPEGRADLERSVTISEEIDSISASHHCGILADFECSYGNLGKCFELQGRARGHAERFGHAAHIQWLSAERVAEHYWTGRWQEAIAVADAFLADTEDVAHFMEPYCHATLGRIHIARGDVTAALDDTLAALEKARSAEDPQMLCPALAVRARALAAAGARQDADAVVDELLAMWRDKLNLFLTSAWVVDLAWALDGLDRSGDLDDIAAGVRARTPWLEAALACTARRFDVAADLLAEIGSLPDESLARLRSAQAGSSGGVDADARRDLDVALSFFREVDATAYLHEAEAVLVS